MVVVVAAANVELAVPVESIGKIEMKVEAAAVVVHDVERLDDDE